MILGNTLLKNTCISSEDHRVAENVNKAVIKGYVACAISGLLGNKVYLEPQNPQHLENMKNNALQSSGCMNFGAGFLEVLQDKVIGEN